MVSHAVFPGMDTEGRSGRFYQLEVVSEALLWMEQVRKIPNRPDIVILVEDQCPSELSSVPLKGTPFFTRFVIGLQVEPTIRSETHRTQN